MPAKRPLPLSDAALGHKGEGNTGDLTNQSAIGETNDGLPLPVKNTFIDVPSGFSPAQTPTDHGQPVSTAPAQVHYQGFLKRAVLDSVEETSAAPDGLCSQGVRGPPVRSGLASNVVPATPPLMTPSPTGTSLFSDRRYELFGGPLPLKEVPAVAPGPGQAPATQESTDAVHAGGFPLSGASRKQAPVDLLYQNNQSTQSQTHHGYGGYGLPAHPAQPCGSLFAPVREPAGALGTEFARMALGKADSDDEDADSEAERQQAMLAASGRTIETAPKPPAGALHPSLGSEFHESGNCKRCCFYPRNRCLNGYECEFCHYEHEKRKRKNKKNKKKKTEAGDQMDDFFAEGTLTDLGWQPGQMQPSQMPPARAPAQMPPATHPQHPAAPAHLHPASGSGGAPYMDAPLTYQWTDGLPGQTPAPPIIPGYEDYVAACCSRRLPGIEPPALATNPPPQQQAQAYYENHERAPSYPGPGYDAPAQLQPPYFGGPSPAPGALDPAAAPWVPPTSPPYASTQPSQSSTRMAPLAECDVKPRQAATASDQAGLPGPGPGTIEGSSPTIPETDAKKASEVKDSSALEVLKTSATHSNTNNFLPHKEAADTPQQAQLNLDMPNMPPPDSSPKLSTDLMTLQQDPPPPDQSPTLPT